MPAIRLRFSRTHGFPPAYLHFGEAPPPIETCIATSLVVGPIGLGGDTLRPGMVLIGHCASPVTYAGGILAQRHIVEHSARTAFSRQDSLPHIIHARQSYVQFIPQAWRANVPLSLPGDSGHRARYAVYPGLHAAIRTGYEPPTSSSAAGRVRHDLMGWRNTSVRGRYSIPHPVAEAGRITWPFLYRAEITRRATGWLSGNRDVGYIIRTDASRHLARQIIARYGISHIPTWTWPRGERAIIPPPRIPTVARIFFQRTNTAPAVAPLHFGKQLIPPQSRRILVMNPTFTVVRLPDRLPIDCFGASIPEQIDSWAKTFSFQTNWSGVQALFEGGSLPNQIEVTVNGYACNLVAETYRETAQYGVRRYTVMGYDQAILLASPHSLIRSYTEENTRTAQQLAAQELPQGWTLSWQLVNWEVPAGVWSYQNLDPIRAISRIVQAAGGFLQTHLTEKTLIARPTYSTSIWALNGVTPEAIITGDSQISVDVEQPPNPGATAYNGVFLSGIGQGVAGLIRVPGTQGEKQVIIEDDALILDISVLRERGREELCMAWPRPLLSVQVPLQPSPGSPGLLRPGDIVEVRTEYAIFRDIVVSTEINVSIQNNGLVVRQHLRVGSSVANPWVAMDSLFPKSPMLSVGVLAHNSDGTSTVELPGGTQIRVQGQSVDVGLMAFIKDDRIIGEAPDLPTYTLDAFDAAP